MKRIYLLLIFVFGIQLIAMAQSHPGWTVETDAKSLAKGDNFRVTFSLENVKGVNFTPPDFKFFQVQGPPARGTSNTFANGRTSYSSSWTYNLKAEKTGKFWINPASIEINGKKVFTNKIQIEVVRGRISKTNGKQEIQDLKQVVYLKSRISDSVAVVGQPLVYELRLYWVPDLLNARLISEPNLNGFYQEDNPRGAYRTIKEAIDGQTFRSKTLYRSVLYPQQEGKLTIGSYRIYADVEKANGRRVRSFFGTSPEYIRLDLKSKPLDIQVVSLPQPEPQDFSGAVGSLEMQCRVDQRVVTTDDAVSLTITLTGEGDTKQMQAPRFVSTDSLEVYPPKIIKEESYETAQGILKEKSFEYVLLPKYPGKYAVSPKYAYFDAVEMQYKYLACDTIELRVSQGSNPIGKADFKEPVIDDGLASINKSNNATGIPNLEPLPKPVLGLMFGLPVLGMLFMMATFYRQKNNPQIDPLELKRIKAREMALEKLAVAKIAMDQNEPRQFYDELSKGMHGYLEDKIGIPLSSLNEGFIREKLTSLALEESLVEKFMGVLKNCQMALYAGKTDEAAMHQSYTEAEELIETLEEQLLG